MEIAQPSSSLFTRRCEKYRGDFVYFLVCTSLPRYYGNSISSHPALRIHVSNQKAD